MNHLSEKVGGGGVEGVAPGETPATAEGLHSSSRRNRF